MSNDGQGISAELEKVLKNMTPGPWAWDNRGEKCDDIQVGVACDKQDRPIAGIITDEIEDVIYVEDIAQITSNSSDANGICWLRNHAEELTYAADRLAEMEAAHKVMHEHMAETGSTVCEFCEALAVLREKKS